MNSMPMLVIKGSPRLAVQELGVEVVYIVCHLKKKKSSMRIGQQTRVVGTAFTVYPRCVFLRRNQ